MDLFITVLTAVAYLSSSRLGALLLLLAAAYYVLATKGSIYERLLKVIVYSSAYYTFDIFGGRQRLSLCIIAIAFLCILLTLNMLKRGAQVSVAAAVKLIAILVFAAAYFLSVLGSYDSMEAIFTTYHLVLLAYMIFIIPVSKDEELNDIDTTALMKIFIRGICAVTITLYIQYGAHTFLGISLGEVYEFNSDRVIYNVYFFSKSVVSLYLAVGLLHYFIDYIDNKQFSALIWMGLLSGAILINNSRTGLACFAVCAGLTGISETTVIGITFSKKAIFRLSYLRLPVLPILRAIPCWCLFSGALAPPSPPDCRISYSLQCAQSCRTITSP